MAAIIERKVLLDAYVRALLRGLDHRQACVAAAEELKVGVDQVLETVRLEYTGTTT